jgi:hypothetical protein
MEVITEKKKKLFIEYEGIIIKAIRQGKDRNISLDKFVDNFIEYFRTDEERNQIKELTFQIESAINTIHLQKNNMMKEIDISYTYSSHLLALTTARATCYYKAIERIEEHYKDKKIIRFIKEYKNL